MTPAYAPPAPPPFMLGLAAEQPVAPRFEPPLHAESVCCRCGYRTVLDPVIGWAHLYRDGATGWLCPHNIPSLATPR